VRGFAAPYPGPSPGAAHAALDLSLQGEVIYPRFQNTPVRATQRGGSGLRTAGR
jgi:hypothetical protein